MRLIRYINKYYVFVNKDGNRADKRRKLETYKHSVEDLR